MDKEEIKNLWIKHKLSTRNSYSVELIKKLCPEFKIEFQDKWIYTELRYRELSDGTPRVDGEDFLIAICKKHKIKPNPKKMKTANMMLGEGSRRGLIQEAYLGEE